MIRIEITQCSVQEWTEKKNLPTKEAPTDKVRQREYGGGTEVIMAREYAVYDVTQSREVETVLLKQEIAVDDDLDLKAVIRAINGIS